jgi:hypothetical protein
MKPKPTSPPSGAYVSGKEHTMNKFFQLLVTAFASLFVIMASTPAAAQAQQYRNGDPAAWGGGQAQAYNPGTATPGYQTPDGRTWNAGNTNRFEFGTDPGANALMRAQADALRQSSTRQWVALGVDLLDVFMTRQNQRQPQPQQQVGWSSQVQQQEPVGTCTAPDGRTAPQPMTQRQCVEALQRAGYTIR